ncbi:hypothetical protein V8E54_002598 [Elaphomyces granulatus]
MVVVRLAVGVYLLESPPRLPSNRTHELEVLYVTERMMQHHLHRASFTFSKHSYTPSVFRHLPPLSSCIDNHIHWRQFWKDYGNVTPFATRGRKYIRKSMLHSLAAYHGILSEEKLDSFFGVEDAAFEKEIDVEKEVKSDIAHLVSKIKAKTSHGREFAGQWFEEDDYGNWGV